MHDIIPFLLAIVAVIVLLNMWATKLKIAYPILLVVGGLLISFVPGLPAVRIDPDLSSYDSMFAYNRDFVSLFFFIQ